MGNRKGERGVFAGTAGGVSIEALERRELLAAVMWDGGAGTANWHEAANWSTDTVPGIADDVTIPATTLTAINYTGAAGATTVNSLISAEALNFQAGSLAVVTSATVTSTVTLNPPATLEGGSWTVPTLTSLGGTLRNVALLGTISQQSSTLTILGGTTFSTLRFSSGISTVTLPDGYVLNSSIVTDTVGQPTGTIDCVGTLTIGPNGGVSNPNGSRGFLTLGGAGTTLINHGAVSSASTGTGGLAISPATLHNTGTITVTSSSMWVGGNWTNTGTIGASNASLTLSGTWTNSGVLNSTNATLRLAGVFTPNSIGTLNRTGGIVDIAGQLNLSASPLELTASTGAFRLNGGFITGGSITATGGATFRAVAGTLLNVTVATDIWAEEGGFLDIAGTTTFPVARMVGSGGGNIRFSQGYVLNSTVRAESTSGARTLLTAGTGTLTIGPLGRIESAAQHGPLNLGDATTTLVCQGTLAIGSGTMNISAAVSTLAGAVQATGGTLVLNNAWSMTGSFTASNATVTFNGSWNVSGGVSITDTTLNLGGVFTLDALNGGTFARTRGSVVVTGTLLNSVLSLDAAMGSWTISGGTIANCSIAISGGSQLLCTSGTINSCEISGDIHFTQFGNVNVVGATTFDVMHLQSLNYVRFSPGYTLNSTIRAEGSGTSFRGVYTTSPGQLTFGPGAVVESAEDCLGDLLIGGVDTVLINFGQITNRSSRATTIGAEAFINASTISATAGTLVISGFMTNTGLLAATNATLTLSGIWSNSGGIRVTNSSLNLGGTFTSSGIGIAGFQRVGGTVTITGQLINSSLTLNDATGSWELNGGIISGGTLSYADGASLLCRIGSLQSVSVNGDLFLAEVSQLDLEGTTSFAVAHVISGARLRFAAGYVLNSVVRFDGVGNQPRTVSSTSTGVVTIGPLGRVEFAQGAQGIASLGNASTMLINHGTVAVRGAQQTLTIGAVVLSNLVDGTLTGGTWSVAGGGELSLGTNRNVTTNNASIFIDGPNSLLRGATGITSNSGSLTLAGGHVYSTQSFVNAGILALNGGSALSVAGAFTQASSGELISDLVSASTFGRVTCQTAALAGSLRVVSSSGFDPSSPALSLFGANIISAVSMAGAVALVSQPPLAAGAYVARVNGNRLQLLHNIADMNGDGGVDGDDVILFFSLWDNSVPFADVNGDGGVDGDDVILFFSLWDNGGR